MKILASELDHAEIRGLDELSAEDSRITKLLLLISKLATPDGRKSMTRQDWIAVEHAKAARPKDIP